MPWIVQFYQTERGGRPVRTYLEALPEKAREVFFIYRVAPPARQSIERAICSEGRRGTMGTPARIWRRRIPIVLFHVHPKSHRDSSRHRKEIRKTQASRHRSGALPPARSPR